MKIVRRVPKSINIPIGRHIIITKVTARGIFARNIGEHSEYWLAESLDNFAEVSCKSCKISKVEFSALKNAVIIHHSLRTTANKEWKAIVTKKPQLIKFWHPGEGCMYIWPSVIKQKVIAGEPYCYIEVKQRCYEKPDER